MSMKVLARMQQRLQSSRADSDDTTLFLELMYLGELTLKVMVAGMIAAMDDDRDRHRYRLEYDLIRANGIGDWCTALDDLLTGPGAVTVTPVARVETAELTKNYDIRDEASWQVSAVTSMLEACRALDPDYSTGETSRVALRLWPRHFAWLRNKTRGHGATTASASARIAAPLERSISAIITGFSLFQREWAYLHRNMSGKYRVIPITENASSLEHLKRNNDATLSNGIYVIMGDTPRPVRLMLSDVELGDFYICNGAYNGANFEALSYVTDTRKLADTNDYVLPPTQLPESETEGRGSLDPQGNIFGNLPPRKRDYVERPQLEEALMKALQNDRHAVITLVGRGGIGKTSLALEVLHRLAGADGVSDRFFAALWFSARDVDLTQRGPKLVRPRVVSIGDVADQFADLIQPSIGHQKGFKSTEYLAQQLTKSDLGPLLFVFDNFETVRDPQEMYDWLDTYIRPPNKILITTRLRDFKGDYPVEVGGMRREEFDKLVTATARQLDISALLTDEYRAQLFDQSDGHPYIAKLLLGDLANAGRRINVAQLVAGKDDVLQALFERTFTQLTPLAQRLFLTLCGWRSAVPRLAVEAALLRAAEEPLDTGRAVDQLVRSSMVDVTRAPDGDEFLTVPLAAALFGRKKLQVSTLQNAIQADLEFLRMFGAARESDVSRGLAPRLYRLFRAVAEKAQADSDSPILDSYRPVLEHIARRHAPAWLLMADLYEEQQTTSANKLAIESVRHYLEECPQDFKVWARLAVLCRREGDSLGEAQALVNGSIQPGARFEIASEAAWRINAIISNRGLAELSEDELTILIRTLLDRLDADQDQANATDYSRMAWLAIAARDETAAARYVRKGAERDSTNLHIQKLQKRRVRSTK